MRILYVVQNYQPMNASSITTYEIIKKLAERGYEITLLAPQRCPKECIRNCSLECKGNANIIVTRVPAFAPYYLINRYRRLRGLALSFCHLFLVLRGLKIGKRKKFDLIVSQHHPSHLASFSAFLLSRILKLPLIVKTHDVYDSTSSLLEFIYLRMLDNVYRLIFKRADYILVVSGPLRLRMIETYELEKDKVVVFPNGVDIKKFRPDVNFGSLRRNLKLNGKKVILFIGRIGKERGLTLLVKALPKIAEVNSNIMVVFVGYGPKKSDLEKLAHKLNVKRFVKFVDPVDHGEIPKFICMSDVAIGPLVATIDTFGSVPRKVLEYMACAKPVIVCRGGVSQDLITHGYNGFSIPSPDIEGLTSTVSKVINSPELVKKVGLNARKHVEKFHDWDKIISKFEKVLCAAFTENINR